MKSLIKSKENEFKSIDKNLIDNINTLLTSITDKNENKQNEEYKKSLISKDNEIAKLNEVNLSKENEIKRLNKIIEDMKSGSITQEMEENFKKEKEKLLSKISNLELKIYNINDEKNKLNSENQKLNNKLKTNDKNETNEDNKEDNKENNKENNDEIKINYEELLKMKEEIEEKNKQLMEEIKSLKSGQKNEGGNENMEKYDKINSLNANKEELFKEKKIVEDYKSGKIISENTKSDVDSIKSGKLSDYEELRKKFELMSTKNKSYESKIKTLNDNITRNTKNKKDLETIILKQEKKINELNQLIKKKDNKINSKEASINKNEAYSLQLINIIKEQKLQIKNIKKQKTEEESSQIAELKRQINNLENTIELKNSNIESMKKTHKNLQDKYIKICFNIKKQEQDNLLNQAKLLKKQKLARDALKSQNKYVSKIQVNNNLPQFTEESNAFSEVDYPNIKTNPNMNNNVSIEKEKKEMINKTRNEVILPVISTNNSVKIEENINHNNNEDDILVENEWNKLDDINEEMKKIIDEN